MTLRQYIAIMIFGTILSWIIWGVIIFGFDPDKLNIGGFIMFYASLFLSLIGTFSIIGFFIKLKLLKKEEIIFRHIKRTFRQGLFFSLFVILSLLLMQFKLLTWWNFSILLTVYIFLEGLLFTGRKYQNKNYVK